MYIASILGSAVRYLVF